MANDWCELTLEESMDAIIDYRGKTPQKTNSGIPLITAKIIKSGRIETVNEFISEDDYDTWMRRGIPNEGDVVMTTEAPLGEIAQLDGRKIALAQRVITLRGKKDVLDNTFLKYLMISEYVQHQLDGRGTGTTVKGIKQSELRKVMLKFPSFIEQKAIAHILGSLDDKIELNRQMNETLEAMAQALFKSWFVDFDPVIDNALAAGNPIPDEFFERAEQRKAIKKKENQELQNLFPDEFEFNEELGWIPTGWRAVRFADITEAKQGRYLARNKMTDFPDNEYIYPVWGGNEVRGFSEDFLFDSPVVVLTCRGSNCGLLKITEAKSWVTNSSFACTPKFGSAYFLYTYFSNDDFSQSISGSAQPQITYTALKNNLMKFPISEKVVENLSMRLEVLRSKQIFCQKQSEILAKLRDTLLPKLMSGEVRIPDAEALVENV